MDFDRLEWRHLPSTLFVPAFDHADVAVRSPDPQTLVVDYGTFARTYDRTGVDLIFFVGAGNHMTASNEAGITSWAVLWGDHNTFSGGAEFDFVVLVGDNMSCVSTANNDPTLRDGRAFSFTVQTENQTDSLDYAPPPEPEPQWDEVYFINRPRP
jgi:hypothetical protein